MIDNRSNVIQFVSAVKAALTHRFLSARTTAAILLVGVASFGNARANTATWTGTTSGSWGTSTNWSGGSGTNGAPNTSGDSLTFTSATGAGGTTLTDNLMTTSTYSLTGITFNSGSAAYTINQSVTGSGSTASGFTLSGGITNSSTSLQTINDTIALSGTNTMTMTTGGGNLTLGGVLSSTGGVTTAGAGTLTLTGANTFTGQVTIGAGTVVSTSNVAAAGSAQGLGENNTVLLNGGTLRITQANVSQGTNYNVGYNLGTSGGTLDLAAASGSQFVFWNGSLTGSGTLNIIDSTTAGTGSSAETLLITGSSPGFSGNVTIGNGTTNSGWAQYRSLNASPLGTGTITINGGGYLSNDGSNGWTLANNIVLNGGFLGTQSTAGTYSGPITLNAGTTSTFGWANINQSALITYSNVISGAGNLNISNVLNGNTNTAVLSAANTFTGSTTVSAGTLKLQNQLALQNSVLTMSGGGVVFDSSVAANAFTTGGLAGNGNITLANNASTPAAIALTVGNNNNTASYGGVLSGAGSLIKTGTGTETLTNLNTFTGGTTVNMGTLALNYGGSSGTLTGVLTINAGGTVQLTAGDALGYSSPNYTSTVNINGGVLNNATNSNEGYITNFSLTGGSMTSTGGGAYQLNGVSVSSLASPTTSTISGGLNIRGGTITFNTAAGTTSSGIDLLISGSIGGGGSGVVKSGAGTLEVTNTGNSYSGGTTISGGTLQIGNGLTNASLPGAYSISSGARLYLDYATTANPSYATITGAGTLEISTAQAPSASPAWGNTALTSGFTGTFQVDDGRVDAYGASTLGGATNVVLENNAQIIFQPAGSGTTNTYPVTQNFTINGFGYGEAYSQFGSLRSAAGTVTLGGNIILGSTAGILAQPGSPFILNGVISGPSTANLVLSPFGGITINGVNTYTGGTTISDGTVNLTGTAALGATTNSLTVNSATQAQVSAEGYNATVVNLSTTAPTTVGNLSGTINTTTQGTGSATINLANTEAFTVNQTTAGTYAGTLAGSGSLVLGSLSTSTLTLSGANSYSGGTTVNAGTLVFASGSTMTGGNNLNVNGNGVLTMAGSYTGGGQITPNSSGAVVNIASGANITGALETPVSSGVYPTVNIAGNLNVSGNRFILGSGLFTQTAGTVVANDSLVFNDSNTNTTGVYYLGGGSLTVGQGPYGSLVAGGRGLADFFVSQTGSLTVNGYTQAQIAAANGNTYYQLVIGSAYGGATGTSLFVQQGGTVKANGVVLGDLNNGPTRGTYYLNSGTLTTGELAAVNTTGNFIFGGGTLKSSGAFATATSGAGSLITQINSGGATIDTTGGNITWNSSLAAGTTGNVVAPTAANITGGSGYTSAPTVTVTGGGGTGATAVAEINQAGQVVDVVVTNPGSGYTSAPTFAFSGGGGTGASVTGTIATGNGGLTVQGTNTLTLTAASTYTGGTAINSGTLAFGNTAAQTFGSTITGPGTLAQTGTGTTTLTSVLNGFSGNIALASGGLAFGNTSNQSVSGVISGSGALIQSGTATTTLTGVNTYTGPTSITAGTLSIGSTGLLSSSTAGTYSGNIAFGTSAGTFQYNGTATQTLKGVISGGGAVVQNGPGTLVLGGASTYSGGTSVVGGQLNIANSSGSATGSSLVHVFTGGSLGGSGTIAGSVTVDGGGSINLANSAPADVINIGGGLTIGGSAGNASSLTFDGNGSMIDNLAISGVLTINAGGATITINDLNNTIVAGQNYTLATFASGTGAGFTTNASGAITVGGLTLTDPMLSVGVTGSLIVSGTSIILHTTGSVAPATVYWEGTNGTAWNSTNSGNTNFTSDAAGTQFITALPAVNSDVIFAASGAANLTNTLGTNFDIKGLIFQPTDASSTTIGAVTIGTLAGGNTLTLEADGIADANTNGVTISTTTLTPNVSQVWSNTSGAALTVNSAVMGSAAVAPTLTLQANGAGAINLNGVVADGAGGPLSLVISSTGTGSVVLGAANTYTGPTTVTQGNLDLANTNAVQSSQVALSGGTLTFDSSVGSNAFNVAGLTGSGSQALVNTANAAIALTIGGTNASYSTGLSFTGAGSLTKAGTGTIALTGTNTYAGPTSVTGGKLSESNLDANSALALNGGALNYTGNTVSYTKGLTVGANGGEFDTATAGQTTTISTGAVTTGAGLFTVGGAGNTTFNVAIGSGAGGLADTSTGTVTLNGVNTYTGNTSVTQTGGTLAVGSTGRLGATGTYAGTIANAGSLVFNTSTATGNQTLSGVISGAGSIKQNGTNTLYLGNAANTFAGGVTINSGTVSVSTVAQSGTAQSLGTASVVNINGGTLQITQANVAQGTNYNVGYNIGSNGGTLDTATAPGFLFWQGTLTGSGPLSIIDSATAGGSSTADTLLVYNNNSPNYNGNVSIGNGQGNSGWAQIRSGQSAGLGTGVITLNVGGILSADITAGTVSNNIVLNGGALTTQSVSETYSGAVTLNAGTTSVIGWSYNNNAPLTLSGAISGSGNINISPTVSGNTSNTVNFTGVDTYTGTTSILAGALNIGGAGLLSSTANPGVFEGNISMAAGTTFSYGSSQNDDLDGVISGTGTLVENATGTLTLTGVNTYGGNTTITAGTLIIGGANGSLGAGNVYAGAIADNGTLLYESAGGALGSQTITSGITGNGALTVNDAGLLFLTGANTYTGRTTIATASDYLLLGNGAATGSLSPSSAIVDNGTLEFFRSTSVSQGVDFSSAPITGSGGIDVYETGTTPATSTVTFNAANTYSGGTDLTQGIVKVVGTQTATAGPLGTGPIDFEGGTLQYSSTNNYDYSSEFTADAYDGGTIPGLGYDIDVNGRNVTFATGLSDNASGFGLSLLDTAGGGSLTLTGVSTFSGPVTIASGTTLSMGGAGQLGSGNYAGSIANAGTFNLGSSANQTLSGVISGAGVLKQSGAGTTTLTGVNTYTGGTTVSGGTLALGGAGQLGSGNYAGAIVDNATFKDGSSANQTLSGVISGTGAVTQSGGGALTLTAANTYTGLTTVSGGTLNLDNTTGASILGSGSHSSAATPDILVNGGALVTQANNQFGTGPNGGGGLGTTIKVTSGSVNFGATTQSLGDLTNTGGTVTYGAGSHITFSDPTWSGGTDTVNGFVSSATLNVSGGVNTVTGTSTGGAGVVQVSGSANFSGAGSPNVTLNSDAATPGTLQLTGSAIVTADGASTATITSSGTAAHAGQVDLNGATHTFQVGGAATTTGLDISAAVVDSTATGAGLTKTGTGILALSGTNTYTGATTISAGTVQLGDGGTTGKLSTISAIADSGTLAVDRSNTVTQGTDFANNITGSGSFAQVGTGTTILSANGYTGGTTITAGKVYAQNGASGSATGTGPIGISGSGLLGVSSKPGTNQGSVSGAITVSSGGTFYSGGVASGTPATGAGTGAVLTSALNVNGGNLTFALNTGNVTGATVANPNTSTTFISTTSTVNFTGSDTITLVDLTNGGLSLRMNAPYLLIQAGATPGLLSDDSLYSGLVTINAQGVISLDNNGNVLGVFTGGGVFNPADVNTPGYVTPININQIGSDGVTPLAANYLIPGLFLYNGDLEVVPEPGTWALMLGGLALLLVIQRRKRNQD